MNIGRVWLWFCWDKLQTKKNGYEDSDWIQIQWIYKFLNNSWIYWHELGYDDMNEFRQLRHIFFLK